MEGILITKKALVRVARDKFGGNIQVFERSDLLNPSSNTINVEDNGRVIILTDFHPKMLSIIKNISEQDTVLRIGHEPFDHPACHFSTFFVFSILYLLKRPHLTSFHSYATSIPAHIFKNEDVQHLWEASKSLTAFNIGILAYALYNNLKVKNINLEPVSDTKPLYETIKNEFINSSATLMKVLDRGEAQTESFKSPKIQLNREDKLKIPGVSFLKKEFVSGFRKYAPFWKKHMYEDHFAMLSAIYSGKEDSSIGDREWIRIMFELLEASSQYEDKHKVARRIFPIYALYLSSINDTYIKEKFYEYVNVLEEESHFWKN